MDERCTITLNFPVQVKSITSDCLSQTVTTSGQYMTSTSPKNYTFTCELEEGYKISGIDFTDGTGGYNSLSGFTDNTFTISISGASGISSTVGINVSEVQKVQKSISLDNLARFKAKCDQTYAKVGEGGGITQSTVIERPESLPTATADSPDFVQTPDGTLYRKKATEGGSLLGTWMFNDNVDCSVGYTFNISFTCSYFPSTDFTSLIVSAGPRFGPWNIFYDSGTSQNAYDGLTETTGNWVNEACKTIQITDISALTNEAEFTSWLTANATKQGGGASVSYEYVAQQDAGASGGGTQLKGYSGTIFTNPQYGVRVSAIHADGSITICEGDGGNVDVDNVVRLIIAGELDGTNSRWNAPTEDSAGGGYKITYLGKGWSGYICYRNTTGSIFIEAVPTGNGFSFGAIMD